MGAGMMRSCVLLISIVGLHTGFAVAFVAPTVPLSLSKKSQIHTTTRGGRAGLSVLRAEADAGGMTRRDSLAKIALGGVGLVLGKKFFEGGVYSGSPDLNGRTVIVTGGNTGLGKETCVRLAELGATVVIGSRSQARGDKAAEEVRTLAKSDKVSSMVLDLGSLKSINAFAAEFQSKHGTLDVLVNNAGVMAIPTREGKAEEQY